MSMGKAARRAALAAGVLCAFLAVGVPSFAAVEGDPLPEIQLADAASGKVVEVNQLLSDSVGAIIFMQTSCAACRKELMAFKEISGKLPELKVVVFSVDTGAASRVDRYRESYQLPFPFLHDPEFKTPGLFGFDFTPALVLVDKAGKIALLKGGFRPGDEAGIQEKIEILLRGM